MAQAPEAGHPRPEQISFELEHLALTAEHRLELTGRWFGVRGRRFVRPTLTLIGATKRSRSLAELEHKPWAAEDGTSWTAAFSLQDPGEDVEEMELAVAPDIAVSLAAPAELAQLPRERVPSRDAVTAPRASRATRAAPGAGVATRAEAAPDAPTAAEERQPPARRKAAVARETIEEQRLKIRALEEQLERASGSEVELRSALGRRDAAVEKLEAVLEQSEDQAREQAVAEDKRESAERERLAALRERDEARQGWRDAHQGWAEVVRERDQTAQERDRALVARDRALAERDQLASELDRMAAEHDRLASELERLAGERDWAREERDRAAAQRDQTLAERDQTRAERDQRRDDRAGASVRRPVMVAPEQRPRGTVGRRASGWVVWTTRLFALLVLAAAVAAIVVIIHSA